MAEGKKIEHASPVDADKLWRDRVNSELQHQRNWNNEYGFMLDEKKREMEQMATLDLNATKRLGYGGLKSTTQSSFQMRPSPEQFRETTHNRKRFKEAS